MKPSIGRIIHYRSYGSPGGEFTSECRAAIVTAICPMDEDCSLFVANPTGVFLNQECAHDEETKAGGTWHWPERVD